LVLAWVKPRRWGWVLLGTLPLVVVTGAYHMVAFGSPFSIGYDHHTNFEFARERLSTFDGNPLTGAWTLWGLGRGAGVLAQAPILLIGLVGLWRLERRLVLALAPWAVLLCFHHTPWGGAGVDHRYLVPAAPLLALGVGHLWERAHAHPMARLGLVALTALSGVLTWLNFLGWRS
jgi:hypothetical protein